MQLSSDTLNCLYLAFNSCARQTRCVVPRRAIAQLSSAGQTPLLAPHVLRGAILHGVPREAHSSRYGQPYFPRMPRAQEYRRCRCTPEFLRTYNNRFLQHVAAPIAKTTSAVTNLRSVARCQQRRAPLLATAKAMLHLLGCMCPQRRHVLTAKWATHKSCKCIQR